MISLEEASPAEQPPIERAGKKHPPAWDLQDEWRRRTIQTAKIGEMGKKRKVQWGMPSCLKNNEEGLAVRNASPFFAAAAPSRAVNGRGVVKAGAFVESCPKLIGHRHRHNRL